MKPILMVAALFALFSPTLLKAKKQSGDGDEISAIQMRQYCQGMEAAYLDGSNIQMDTEKYPDVLICFGVFATIQQQSLAYDVSDKPLGKFRLSRLAEADLLIVAIYTLRTWGEAQTVRYLDYRSVES